MASQDQGTHMTKTQLLIPLFSIFPLFGCNNSSVIDKNDIIDETDIDDTVDPSDFEEGCFMVDGEYGFRWLNDAVTIASDGSVITMNNCDAEHTEQVVIDKSITLIGSGKEGFTLIAPVNETAITILAPDVTIKEFSIESTRSGLSIEADRVRLEDLDISGVGNFAIKTTDAFDLEFTTLDLIANGDGAIHIDGGSVTADSLNISENVGIGIKIDGAGILNLTNSIVELTQASNPEDISDGFGILMSESAVLESQGNIYNLNTLVGVQSISGSINLIDDEVSNSLLTGIWVEGNSSLSLTNVIATDNGIYGVIMMGTGDVDINGLAITVDPEISPSYHVEEWADNGSGSMGLYVLSANVILQDVSISGYNNCGANLQVDSTSESNLFIDGLTIDNVGRKGLYLVGYEGSINNLSITNISDLDDLRFTEPDPETAEVTDNLDFCGLIDQNIGAGIIFANVDLSNVNIEDVQGYGITMYQSNSVIDTIYTTGATCAGTMAFQSSLTINNGEWLGYNATYDVLGSSLVGYQSTLLQVNNSSFQGVGEDFFGTSVYAYDGDNFFFEGNTFTDSSIGIYTNDASLALTNNTFQNQISYSLYLLYGETRNHSLTDNIFQSEAALDTSAIQCYSGGNIEMNGDYFFDIYGSYAMTTSGCNVEMEDVSFENIGSYALYGYGGDFELDSISFTNTGLETGYSQALYFYASAAMNISVLNTTFESTSADAISMNTYDSVNYPINAILDTVSITNPGDDGIYINGATVDLNNITITDPKGSGLEGSSADITLNNAIISGSKDDAIYCSNCTLDISNSSIDLSDGKGVLLSGTDATFSVLTVENSTEQGISATNGDISFTGSTISNNGSYGAELRGDSTTNAVITVDSSDFSGNAQTGLYLEYADVAVTAASSTNNTEYGLECLETIFSSCTMSDITGNTLGEQTGCDETCGAEANPNPDPDTGDTGIGDTGITVDTGDSGS